MYYKHFKQSTSTVWTTLKNPKSEMEIFNLMTIVLMMWLSYSFYTIRNEFKKSCDEINEKVDKLQKELSQYKSSLNK